MKRSMENEKERCYMANMIVRDELKASGVRHWELAHALGVSEQTLVVGCALSLARTSRRICWRRSRRS